MHRINSCSINLAKHKLNILCTNYVPTTIEVTLHLFPHKFFRQRSVKYLYLLQKQAFRVLSWKFLNFLHCMYFQSQGWYYGIMLTLKFKNKWSISLYLDLRRFKKPLQLFSIHSHDHQALRSGLNIRSSHGEFIRYMYESIRTHVWVNSALSR